MSRGPSKSQRLINLIDKYRSLRLLRIKLLKIYRGYTSLQMLNDNNKTAIRIHELDHEMLELYYIIIAITKDPSGFNELADIDDDLVFF